MNQKITRWKQRFVNFEKAFLQLEQGLGQSEYTDLEREGVIQRFEYTFELSWKTLKDYLESQGVECKFPREVIKQAIHTEVIQEGRVWLEMLENRNKLAHTYDEFLAEEAFNLINTSYFPLIQKTYLYLKGAL